MSTPRGPGLRLDAALAQSREPAFFLGPDLRVVGVNRAFEGLTGRPADRLVGLACGPKPAGGRGRDRDRGDDLEALGASLRPPPEAIAGRPSGGTVSIPREGGGRAWRRVEYWPIHDEAGALLGLFGLVRPAGEPPGRHAPDSESLRLRGELNEVRARLASRHGIDTLVGRGPAHRRVLEGIRIASRNAGAALIVGEPGTGRRAVAGAIHALAPRRLGPLLAFDVAALPVEALARQLFGANRDRDDEEADDPDRDRDRDPRDFGPPPGLAVPDGSTVVVGDVLDLPRDLQRRLARAIDGRVRLLATTAGDPEAALRSDRLRPDLYHALAATVIRLDPLRDRLGDLPILAQHFLERANDRDRRGRRRAGFAPEALAALAAYHWPGNLRELARVVDASHGVGPGEAIGLVDLPASIRGPLAGAYLPPAMPRPRAVAGSESDDGAGLDEILVRVERRMIERALAKSRGNKSRAADLLGISRPRLYRRIEELGLGDEGAGPGPGPGNEPSPPPAD